MLSDSLVSLRSNSISEDVEAPRSSRVTATRTATFRRQSGMRYRFIFAAAALLCLFWWLNALPERYQGIRPSSLIHAMGPRDRSTLVVYVYSFTDPEYEGNLRYFLEHGVAADDGVDYVIVMQEGESVLGETRLPTLPANVRLVRHPNSCFDWGTFGWVIGTKHVDTARYRYVLFLNSSVRGPFLPPYWPRALHWTEVLTSRLTDQVKLVGSTISCEGTWKDGVLTGEKRQNPHIQSYVVAMDQVSLNVLRSDASALQCYEAYHDAVWYAEMGSSAAILRAGFNIDSLMLRYQGVDWRDTNNWGCNAALNPYAEYMYDGINLSPFEVMFVKMKEYLLEANWTTATEIKKYTEWARDRGQGLASNEYTAKQEHLRRVKVLGMRERGPACFDFDFYKLRNPDLPIPPWTAAHMWDHFVDFGQHEGRVFRFKCTSPGVKPNFALPSPPPPVTPAARASQGTDPRSAAAGASQGAGGQAEAGSRAAGAASAGAAAADAQGASAQGALTQGAAVQGASAEGAAVQGTSTQGASVQGTSTQGAAVQGTSTQGAAVQGASAEGTSSQGGSTQTLGGSTPGTASQGASSAVTQAASGAAQGLGVGVAAGSAGLAGQGEATANGQAGAALANPALG
ncbi:hypothetical protein ACKKBG_A37960 [Auxenochlorella protothecoides x Auxenochlorella symbiontica]